MRVTIEFDSMEELENFRGTKAEPEKPAAKRDPEPEPAAETPKPDPEPEPAAETPKPDPEPEVKKEKVDESFRVEVRRVLSKLNKTTGTPISKDLIKEFGTDKLTEVKLEDLPALMEKAKEALDNAR